MRPDPPRRRRIWPWLVALLIIGVIVVAPFVVLAKAMKAGMAASASAEPEQLIEEKIVKRGGRQKIVRIDLTGIITGSASRGKSSMVEVFQAQVACALRDPLVSAIVVRIHSPGGEVTASDILHHTLQQADTRKPVIAYMDGLAASGGYYTACGARRILAHGTTLTGSIGVIIQSPNYRELLDKIGLRMDVYKSGNMKDLLSGAREPTPAEKEHIQALVRQTYERFLEVVSASRRKPVAELRDSPLADGRIYSGKDALGTGMVDQLGFIEDAYDEAMRAAGVTDATVVRYAPRGGLLAALGLLGEAAAAQPRVEIDVADRILPRLEAGIPYYLHLPAPAP